VIDLIGLHLFWLQIQTQNIGQFSTVLVSEASLTFFLVLFVYFFCGKCYKTFLDIISALV
jgi:hypothetical protein